MDEWLKKVMVEHTCPDCGGKRLKPQRFLVTIAGKDIHELGTWPCRPHRLPGSRPHPEKKREAGTQIVREIVRRVRCCSTSAWTT
jgi:excinuclease ABC subunit A